jgi:hypothetical protein
MNLIDAERFRFKLRSHNAPIPPDQCERNIQKDQQRLPDRMERGKQKREDDRHRNRQNERQSLVRPGLILKLSAH